MPGIEIEDATVTIMVDDLDRSQEFYTGRLGFRVLHRAGPHFSMLAGTGLKLGLHPRGSNPTPGEASGGVSIGLRVSDLDSAVRTLRGAGVDFPDGIVDDDGAIRRADFHDPDGTPLYLLEMADQQ